MKEIRLGTIGHGVIVHSILDNVEKIDGIRCEAVYSRTYEAGLALAATYNVKKVYTDMEQFLRDPDIDAVYIATPNLIHYEQTKRALLAGKHVICEKPFCTKVKDAEELVELAKKSHLMLIEAVPTTFLPNYVALKKLIPEIGKIKLVQANYSQYSSRYDKLQEGEVPNIFNPKYAGGCLMDINFYNVYLNIALFGMPKYASYYPNLWKNPQIDTSGMVMMRYPDFVSVSVGAKDTWGINFFQIEGEEGYIYISGGSNGITSIRLVTKELEKEVNFQDCDDRWFYEVQELSKILNEKNMNRVEENNKITVNTVCLMERIRKDAGIIFPGDN